MQDQHFYTHLIDYTHIEIELSGLDLNEDEKIHLLTLVEANLHSKIIDIVLTQLKPAEKKSFLKNLSKENHLETLSHLKVHIFDIEEKIAQSASLLIEELLKDIREVKTSS